MHPQSWVKNAQKTAVPLNNLHSKKIFIDMGWKFVLKRYNTQPPPQSFDQILAEKKGAYYTQDFTVD